MREFSQNWFSRHIENWKKYVLSNLPEKPACLEIGCFEGRSTLWIRENMNPKYIDAVDTWNGNEEWVGLKISADGLYERFLENTKEYGIEGDRTILPYKCDSKAFLMNEILQKSGEYDFIHVDGDHRARSVFFDVCLSWELLKKGGVIVFDDYEWHLRQYKNEIHRTPFPALEGFLNSFYGEYEILLKSYQLILRKI